MTLKILTLIPQNYCLMYMETIMPHGLGRVLQLIPARQTSSRDF